MGAFEWTLVGIIILGVTAPLAYLLFAGGSLAAPEPRAPGKKPSAPRTRPMGVDPKRAMRKRIKQLGGDPRRIPDAALDAIIAAKSKLADDLAATGLSAYADPKLYRDRALHAEAEIIVSLMRGQRGIAGSEETLEILERHDVIKGAEVARRRLSMQVAPDRALR